MNEWNNWMIEVSWWTGCMKKMDKLKGSNEWMIWMDELDEWN